MLTSRKIILNLLLTCFLMIEWLISRYVSNHSTLNVLLPIGALECVRNLQSISNNQFLLLASDKAHSHQDDLKLTKDNPHLVTHGSFSFMTNFHAIREYILNNNGQSFHTPYYGGLQVAAFVIGTMKMPEFMFSWEVCFFINLSIYQCWIHP